MRRLAAMLISFGLIALVACAQSQKSADDPVARGVASAAAATDFTPDREHFDGSAKSIVHELKLMRGNLERSEVLGISTERDVLLNKNLFDTGVDNVNIDCKTLMAGGREDFILHHRTPTGLCYMHKQGQFLTGRQNEVDLSHLKAMGAAGQRFGRNSPPISPEEAEKNRQNVLTPNPVTVAQTFFSRKNGFQPVPWVNLLATAWLQAENHDWFSHGKNVDMSHMTTAEQQKYAEMFRPYNVDGFIIPRSMPDLTALSKLSPGQVYTNGKPGPLENAGRVYGAKYRNSVTHWWDASHIYGSDEATVRKVRTIPSGVTVTADGQTYGAGQIYPDGKIAVDEQARKLFYRPDPNNDNELLPITGFHDNWWVGLEMIHTIFALEHNKVATFLKGHFENPNGRRGTIYDYYNSIKKDPAKRSEFLYNKARLIVSALIAKIHTVEWTPALLDNPGLRLGMFANWHGIKTAIGDIESPTLRKWVENMAGTSARMLISGLTGKNTLNFYRVPFTLTEEFVSVYRMHPLLSDELKVMRYNSRGDDVAAVIPVDSSRDSGVEPLLTQQGFSSTDFLYSFGRNRAGLMTLHNHPKFMENMEVRRNIAGQKKDQPLRMNMGAVDIVRDRERQTPRYNAFRRMMRMRPINNFDELFITSKVLYQDAVGKSVDYQKVLHKLRTQVAQAGYDVPLIERDSNKISDFSPVKAFKDYRKGGLDGVLNDGRKLVSEDEFYKLYYALPKAEQQMLLTSQEIEDIDNMKRLYGDVEMLDLLVGTLAEEDRYDLFGFGNTPFYIFALMASRRLMTDPFLSDLYTEDVYTNPGIKWVERNSMIDVIKRNFPELAPKFAGVKNAFHPWNPN